MAESAIPAHLRRTRVRTVRVPGDYEPPYPSFSARYRPSVTQVVMAYFGVQWRGPRPGSKWRLTGPPCAGRTGERWFLRAPSRRGRPERGAGRGQL